MTTHQFNKPTNVNLAQLASEILYPANITGNYINVFIDDSLSLTQDQLDAIQTIINNHTPSSTPNTITLQMSELFGCLVDDATIGTKAEQAEKIVDPNNNMIAILQSMGMYQTGLVLDKDGANLILDMMDNKSLIGADSKTAIQNLIESKGLSLS